MFTPEGAEVFNTLTERAAQAGPDARLVIKIGADVRAAVVVMEGLHGAEVTIALSPDEDPQQMVDLLFED